MNRPELLLHVVCSKKVEHRSKLQKQAVFIAEHRGRPHERSLREDIACYLFSTPLRTISFYPSVGTNSSLSTDLCRIKLGWGSWIRAMR